MHVHAVCARGWHVHAPLDERGWVALDYGDGAHMCMCMPCVHEDGMCMCMDERGRVALDYGDGAHMCMSMPCVHEDGMCMCMSMPCVHEDGMCMCMPMPGA